MSYYLLFYVLSSFFFSCYVDHRDLHSFPTRRSSDLPMGRGFVKIGGAETDPADIKLAQECWQAGREAIYSGKYDLRSEEHTSELQSRQYLVCRLLLEKKKNKQNEKMQ